MAKKGYKDKTPCDTIDCLHWQWQPGQNKMCLKPKTEQCLLQGKKNAS